MQKHKPVWLKRSLPTGSGYERVRSLLSKNRLHTVCEEAKCPNIWECFSKQTATFLIMGSRCSRNCRFCAILQGPVSPPDPFEPARLVQAVRELNLIYVVITSVTRDDLSDGGSGHFASVITMIRQELPQVKIEILIPDFQGDSECLKAVLQAGPQVLNHNIETVSRLYRTIRPEADYQRSLEILAKSRKLKPDLPVKSGMMLGLGETEKEIRQTLKDLLDSGCLILTLGQYLQPSKDHVPVHRFVPPEEFQDWKGLASEMGFVEVVSGPLVRSSYRAKEVYQSCMDKLNLNSLGDRD